MPQALETHSQNVAFAISSHNGFPVALLLGAPLADPLLVACHHSVGNCGRGMPGKLVWQKLPGYMYGRSLYPQALYVFLIWCPSG